MISFLVDTKNWATLMLITEFSQWILLCVMTMNGRAAIQVTCQNCSPWNTDKDKER